MGFGWVDGWAGAAGRSPGGGGGDEYAITTDGPELRYLVGVTAKPFAEGRARITEEYMDFGREVSDDGFWAEFARLFPMPTA